MRTEDFTEITLEEFLDFGDHPGHGKRQVIQMAEAAMNDGEDLLYIVRGDHFKITQESIKALLVDLPKEEVDKVVDTPLQAYKKKKDGEDKEAEENKDVKKKEEFASKAVPTKGIETPTKEEPKPKIATKIKTKAKPKK